MATLFHIIGILLTLFLILSIAGASLIVWKPVLSKAIDIILWPAIVVCAYVGLCVWLIFY